MGRTIWLRNALVVGVVMIGLLTSTIYAFNNSVCPSFNGQMCNGADMTLGCDKYCDCWGFGGDFASPYYDGVACEATNCYQSDLSDGIVLYNPYSCSGRGNCINPNICQCSAGYTGFQCQYAIADISCNNIPANSSSVCNGKGKCLQPNECFCNTGYEGTNCEMFKCYGYLKSDSNTCSGKGKCIDWNVCDCENGYSGTNCDMMSSVGSSMQKICFGLTNNNGTVCNGHGVCVGPDTCMCNSGYFGDKCQNSYCFSKQQNDSSVCNGRGYCNGKDTCDCYSQKTNVLISGAECELIQCKGTNGQYFYSTENNKVCSGKGVCTVAGCNCTDGFSGEYCQDYSCFGISKESTSACSGHGSCSSPDTCSCFSNSTHGFWMGSDCNVCDLSHHGLDCLSNNTCDRFETCNGQGTCASNNTCVCDEGFKGEFCDECATDRYGWDCSQSCSRIYTCLGHGDCSRDGMFCECDNSQSLGFWKGKNCSSCVDGYYGDSCLTRVGTNFAFNSLGNEIFFDLNAPSTYLGGVVDCSKLLSPSSYSAVGSSFARCVFKTPDSPSTLTIELASTSSIKPGDSLEVNLKVFDSQNQPRSLTTLTNSGSAISSPVAEIVYTNTLVKFTENLILTGRNSLNTLRERVLYYEWKLLSSGSSFNSLSSIVSSGSGLGSSVLNISNIDLPANNSFSIQLRVKNSDFNIWSLPVFVNFTKEEQPIVQSVAKKYEVYIHPPADPLYLTDFVFPLNIPYEVLEDGVPVDTTSFNTITWSFEPNLQRDDGNGGMQVVFYPDVSTNSIYVLDGDFPYMDDNVVVVKCKVTVNSVEVASSSFSVKYIKAFRPSLSRNKTDTGIYFTVGLGSFKGVPIQKTYWKCRALYTHLGKCTPEMDALFDSAANSKSVFIPNEIGFIHRYKYYVYVDLVVTDLHFKLSAYGDIDYGLEISQFNSWIPTSSYYHHMVLKRSQPLYSFSYSYTDRQVQNTLYSLFDEFGTNITNIVTSDVANGVISFNPSDIPPQSNMLTLSLWGSNNTNVYRKNLIAYVDSFPKSNCSVSFREQQISVPTFNGVLYFYNVTVTCETTSKVPSFDVYLKNQGTDLLVSNNDPMIPPSQSFFMVLPELIGPTEVYVNITHGTEGKIVFLPESIVSERISVGYLRESQTTPSTEIESLQQMFFQYFSDPGTVANTSKYLQLQIKRLLYLYYPEKELSYPNIS